LPSAHFEELEEVPAPGTELPLAELHDVGKDGEEGGGPDGLGEGDGGEEGGLGVDLRNEEVVDVEELGELFHGQVFFHGAVVPFAGRFGAFGTVGLPHVEVAYRLMGGR